MKLTRQAFTLEFKELAVRRVKDGQSVGAVCKDLGLSDQTLRNWVKASAAGRLQFLADRDYAANTFSNYLGVVSHFAQWMHHRRPEQRPAMRFSEQVSIVGVCT